MPSVSTTATRITCEFPQTNVSPVNSQDSWAKKMTAADTYPGFIPSHHSLLKNSTG